MKTLAKITPDRTLNFTDEGQVYFTWDHHNFTLTYHEFVALTYTLDVRRGCEYAREGDFTLVRVDATTYELWIDGVCLTLTARDYRSLRNAALSTKTRLYGVMRSLPKPADPLADVTLRPVGAWRMPRPVLHGLN